MVAQLRWLFWGFRQLGYFWLWFILACLRRNLNFWQILAHLQNWNATQPNIKWALFDIQQLFWHLSDQMAPIKPETYILPYIPTPQTEFVPHYEQMLNPNQYKSLLQYLNMQKDSKDETKQPPLATTITASKLQIPRYSDKFKDIIAKSELARQQTTKLLQAEPEPLPHTPQRFFFYRIRSIGVGAHSFVYLVQEQQSHLLLAQKAVTRQHAKEIAEDVAREIKILLHLNHENIIKLYHFYASETHLNLLLQFAEDSLFALKQRFTIFKQKQIVEVLRQLLLGLKYLHSKNIVHADVKLQNIMIANGTIKLCDFGLAHVHPLNQASAADKEKAGTADKEKAGTADKEKVDTEDEEKAGIAEKAGTADKEKASTGDKEKELAQVVGTLEYLPPEYVQGIDSGQARDIWAVGVLAFQMLLGRHPFEGLKQSDKWAKLIKNPPQCYYQELKELEKQLGIHSEKIEELVLHIFVGQHKRWTAQQLLHLPFFNVHNS